MIDLSFWHSKKMAVVGLGKSGLATVRALSAAGADVIAADDSPARNAELGALALPGIQIAAPDAIEWHGVAALVLSPGIALTHPVPHAAVTAAKSRNIPVIGDIELLCRAVNQSNIIGITGTNGKSTTTALLGHILHSGGRRVEIGGNLGRPALDLETLGSDGWYVLELSSYQLDLSPTLQPKIALLLNITPDHLDRHGDFAGYVAVKEKIFANQTSEDIAIISIDDDPCRAVAARLASRQNVPRLVPISVSCPAPGGLYVKDGALIDDLDDDAHPVLTLAEAPHLPGLHNAQNIAAAYAAARIAEIPPDAIVQAIKSFSGLAHRQEWIAMIDGITFINDSKATNAEAAAKALGCYDTIYWIAGGIEKAGGIESLTPYFPRLRHAYLIGRDGEKFAETLGAEVPHMRCETLAEAVTAAHNDSRRNPVAGAVVLLSPAAASFDQYSGFEARGDEFRRLVHTLAKEVAS